MADDAKSVALPGDCKITHSQIKIFDLPNGGKAFVSPVMREFRLKMNFTIILVVLAGLIGCFTYPFLEFIGELPFAWARFIAINLYFSFFWLLGLIALMLACVCADMWLRATDVIAVSGELKIVSRWLIFKRRNTFALPKIIEIKAANNTTVNDTYYYDIMVFTEGQKQSWLAPLWYPNGIPNVSENFTESDRKVLISGGKKIRAITNIEGETEANWILEEINRALGRK